MNLWLFLVVRFSTYTALGRRVHVVSHLAYKYFMAGWMNIASINTSNPRVITFRIPFNLTPRLLSSELVVSSIRNVLGKSSNTS